MSPKVTKLPAIADPTIDEVLDRFLDEQRERLADRTFRNYDDVVHLLRDCLNGYAYERLSKEETAFFERHFNAEGDDHREFCELFGPEKILGELDHFLSYFMIRKVIAGEDFVRAAGTVARKLAKWLIANSYVVEDDAREVIEDVRATARDVPRAARAARLLVDAAVRLRVYPDELGDDDFHDFDHYTIAKVEPDAIWLDMWEPGPRRSTLGPIPVPQAATKLLREGWDVSCALARVRGTWRMIDVANVYPR
jgi:hypothetical protein